MINKLKIYYWLKKGNALSNEVKHQEALDCYNLVLNKEPNHPLAWSFKGTALLALARYSEAREALLNFTKYALPRHADYVKQAKDLIRDIEGIIKTSDRNK